MLSHQKYITSDYILVLYIYYTSIIFNENINILVLF